MDRRTREPKRARINVICQTCWTTLRVRIEAAGLGEHVAQTGMEAGERMAAGRPDPLMAAHNAIMARAASVYGVPRMATPGFCAICINGETWMDGAVDVAREAAQRGDSQ